jgi:hypothetical protein
MIYLANREGLFHICLGDIAGLIAFLFGWSHRLAAVAGDAAHGWDDLVHAPTRYY